MSTTSRPAGGRRSVQIEVSGGTWDLQSVALGDTPALVGAPSFDRDRGLVHVGTAPGVFYAVQVPLP